jgi:putative oxidoreductase
MQSANNYIAAIGRVGLALIFIFTGLGKLAAPEATQAYIAAARLPLPAVAFGVAVLVELVGGLAFLFGYKSRTAAAALAIFSLAAAQGFHSNFGDQNQMIHFVKNIAMAGGLLQVVAFGSGAISIDGMRASKRTS